MIRKDPFLQHVSDWRQQTYNHVGMIGMMTTRIQLRREEMKSTGDAEVTTTAVLFPQVSLRRKPVDELRPRY